MHNLDLVKIRNAIQICFSFFMFFLGVKLYFFAQHFLTDGATDYVVRPAGVDGFLPISALMSLKLWLSTGIIDPHHPAALVILLSILATSFIFKKSFCSWLCPVGTISEGTYRLGKVIIGKNFKLPKILDILLMSLKYFILLFFVFAILQMNSFVIATFLKSSYNKVADIKMMYFFLNMSFTTAITLAVLFFLSIFIKNFWCRYLCPYGALLGIISFITPFKVNRNDDLCVNCKKCDMVCPNSISVSSKTRVCSIECTSCLNCVNSCPKHGALTISSTNRRFSLPVKLYPLFILTVFFGIILIGKLTGNWHSIVTYEEYHLLINNLNSIVH